MKTYEVIIENRKNTVGTELLRPYRIFIEGDNEQFAKDWAFEIFHEEFWKMSRGKVKITANRI